MSGMLSREFELFFVSISDCDAFPADVSMYANCTQELVTIRSMFRLAPNVEFESQTRQPQLMTLRPMSTCSLFSELCADSMLECIH